MVCRIAPARAEPQGAAALIWHAPAGCPTAAEVRARIERRLGASLDPMAHGIAITVAIRRDGGAPRFVARIDLRGASGRDEVRTLTSTHCDDLTDAVAVVVARIASEAVEPEVRGDRRDPPADAPLDAPAVAPAGPADGAAEIRAERSAEPAPAVPPRSWGAGVRAMGQSGIGVVPGVGVAGELGGYLRVHSLIVELAAAQWMTSPRFLVRGAPGRVDVGLATGALRVGWGSERMPLRAWVEGEVGAIYGSSVAFYDPRVGSARWIAAGAGFAVAWPMAEHARLVGTIELVVPVRQAPFMLQDGTEVYRPGVVTVRSGLGLEIGWW